MAVAMKSRMIVQLALQVGDGLNFSPNFGPQVPCVESLPEATSAVPAEQTHDPQVSYPVRITYMNHQTTRNIVRSCGMDATVEKQQR